MLSAEKIPTSKLCRSQAPVAYTCNPIYLGDRVPSQPRQIVLKTLFRKNSSQKRAGGVGQGEGSEFKPQYWEEKKKNTLQEGVVFIFVNQPNTVPGT
jgi:hypothetical protein